MSSIVYVGMDVHTVNYTLCCYILEGFTFFAETTIKPYYQLVLEYLRNVEKMRGEECHFICGYEAGCLGYSLYNELTSHGIECIILAPSTMATQRSNQIVNDKRDAQKIATCLAYNTYSHVHVPTEEDNAVKEYIRLRDDVKATEKRIKQQIIAFCTRNGKLFTEGRNYWTKKHLDWIKRLTFSNVILYETLQEYLTLYYQAIDKIKLYDKRIEEFANTEQYKEKVDMLSCFIGVKTLTALATIVEVGDFQRFPTASHFASYLGLVPGEDSSGSSIRRTGITKAGNSHIRKLLIESAQSYSRGAVGKKSKALIARQKGQEPKVIAYADRANERLKRKFYRMVSKSNRKRNVAVAAIARELACFIWGMMTDNIA